MILSNLYESFDRGGIELEDYVDDLDLEVRVYISMIEPWKTTIKFED